MMLEMFVIPKLTKEAKARFLREKAEFDKTASHKYCLRCMSKGAVMQIVVRISTKKAVLPHEEWLCQACWEEVDTSLRGQRDARIAESGQRLRETLDGLLDQKRNVLDEVLTKIHDESNARREADGLPPLPPPKPRRKRKP